MQIVKTNSTKNILSNTKTIMNIVDNVLLPCSDDLKNWFNALNLMQKTIVSIRFYIRDIFKKRTKEANKSYKELNKLIDDAKMYFHEEKYLINEIWWNAHKFQKAIYKIAKYIQDNDTYLDIYLNPSREMLFEISEQKQCDLSFFQLDSLYFLNRLLLIEDLNMQECDISNIDEISHFTYIKTLNIQNNSIEDISVLKNFKLLQWIDASKNKIKDISALEHISSLQQIDFRWNDIQDLTPLKNSKELKVIYMGINNIEDISVLGELEELIVIGLSKNKIRDIRAFKNSKNIVKLLLENNSISDITPLSNMQNVLSLDLRNNKIQDISALFSINKIENIGFCGNNIHKNEEKRFIEKFPECFIHNT